MKHSTAAFKAQRLTVAEVVAAKPSADFDAEWGGWVIRPDFFVSLVYKGL